MIKLHARVWYVHVCVCVCVCEWMCLWVCVDALFFSRDSFVILFVVAGGYSILDGS
jgi:hypothetical protein